MIGVEPTLTVAMSSRSTFTEKSPRKPTAFRRGMNWENYFFLLFFKIFIFFNLLQYLLLYITINID